MTEEPSQQPTNSSLFETLMAAKGGLSERGMSDLFEQSSPQALRDLKAQGFGANELTNLLVGERNQLLNFDPFEEVKDTANEIKDQILEVLGELGITGLPELEEDTEVDTTPTVESTDTQTMQEGQSTAANTQASNTINDPSVGNSGVVVGESSATQPKGAPQNFIENILNAIFSPPANRTGSS